METIAAIIALTSGLGSVISFIIVFFKRYKLKNYESYPQYNSSLDLIQSSDIMKPMGSIQLNIPSETDIKLINRNKEKSKILLINSIDNIVSVKGVLFTLDSKDFHSIIRLIDYMETHLSLMDFAEISEEDILGLFFYIYKFLEDSDFEDKSFIKNYLRIQLCYILELSL